MCSITASLEFGTVQNCCCFLYWSPMCIIFFRKAFTKSSYYPLTVEYVFCVEA